MKLFCLLAILIAVCVICINGNDIDGTFSLYNNLDNLIIKDINAIEKVNRTLRDSDTLLGNLPTRTQKPTTPPLVNGRRSGSNNSSIAYLGQPTETHSDAQKKLKMIKLDYTERMQARRNDIVGNEKSTTKLGEESSTSSSSTSTTMTSQKPSEKTKQKSAKRNKLTKPTKQMKKNSGEESSTSTSTTTSEKPSEDPTEEPSEEPKEKTRQKTALREAKTDRKKKVGINRKANKKEVTQMSQPEVLDIPLSPYTLRARLQELLDLPKYSDVDVGIESLAKTSEYNDIIMLTMTSTNKSEKTIMRAREDKYVEEEHKKKAIMIVHGLDVLGIRHIPALSMEKKFTQLLDYYVAQLDKFNIFLIPMANPDGFQRTFSDMKWAKNVSPQEDCLGVALDRNFEVGWNLSRKVSSCSQSYPGPNAFSEPETRAIRDVLHYHNRDIYAFIHVHAASPGPSIFKGDALLSAPGFTNSLSNDDRYVDLKGDISEGLRNASLGKNTVVIDSMHKWYGLISGSSVDYAASVYGIPFGLEMLMQAYYVKEFDLNDNDCVNIQDVALKQVWKKMMDITFKGLYKSLKKCQKEKLDEDIN